MNAGTMASNMAIDIVKARCWPEIMAASVEQVKAMTEVMKARIREVVTPDVTARLDGMNAEEISALAQSIAEAGIKYIRQGQEAA